MSSIPPNPPHKLPFENFESSSSSPAKIILAMVSLVALSVLAGATAAHIFSRRDSEREEIPQTDQTVPTVPEENMAHFADTENDTRLHPTWSDPSLTRLALDAPVFLLPEATSSSDSTIGLILENHEISPRVLNAALVQAAGFETTSHTHNPHLETKEAQGIQFIEEHVLNDVSEKTKALIDNPKFMFVLNKTVHYFVYHDDAMPEFLKNETKQGILFLRLAMGCQRTEAIPNAFATKREKIESLRKQTEGNHTHLDAFITDLDHVKVEEETEATWKSKRDFSDGERAALAALESVSGNELQDSFFLTTCLEDVSTRYAQAHS